MRRQVITLFVLTVISVCVKGQSLPFEFIKDLRKDYRATSEQIQMFSEKAEILSNADIIKEKKKECYHLITKWLLIQGRNALLAPFCYTLWWWNREKITNRVYELMLPLAGGDTAMTINHLFVWLNQHVEQGTFDSICKKELQSMGLFYYFIWTFSDIEDPLGRGGMPNDYKSGKNTFGNRFLYSAVRNPGGLAMHINQRSAIIIDNVTTIDTRSDEQAKSYGIGNQNLGTWLCWYVSSDDRLYFIYESANMKKLFYCGFVRTFANNEDCKSVEQNRKRFEISQRKNKATTSQTK
jgi:hypothetical protein